MLHNNEVSILMKGIVKIPFRVREYDFYLCLVANYNLIEGEAVVYRHTLWEQLDFLAVLFFALVSCNPT